MIQKSKILVLICTLLLCGMAICALLFLERQNCLSVPIIEEKRLKNYTEVSNLDISLLTFNNKDVAIDLLNNRIFISQMEQDLKAPYLLKGRLKTENPQYTLYFLKNEMLDNIFLATKEGKPLTLIIENGETFQKVDVVITTLPILYLDLEGTEKMEDGRDLMNGKMIIWDNSSKGYKVSTSYVKWHVRGNSTKIYDKQSWKMELKKDNGDNKNLELLGLGSDDDWILNAMSMDDTRVKEKFAQTLWNQIVSTTNHNYKMSSGEYVELFINGAYQGLYLLQRRVDEKYLGLNREKDIVFKGRNTWEADSLGDAYEIISSPYDKETTYGILEKTLEFADENEMNIDNFIDVSAMIQFLSAKDNSGYKNMFYVLKRQENGYELYLVPWDTDLSLGATWTYDYEDSVDEIIERRELEVLRKRDSEIDRKVAERWNDFRTNILSEENIYFVLDEIIEQLEISGALERNTERWGELNEGEDNAENLRLYIRERLMFLDKHYEQFIN